jgi:hypothetical protein
MQVILTGEQPDWVRKKELQLLRSYLEGSTFAERCGMEFIEPVGSRDGLLLRLKLANTPHGVLLDPKKIDARSIEWAINALRESIPQS